ncbi:hypothetical protein STRDD10_00422 [Streptococcus sp. DD10]|uniref:hypothetical protein n=1 Tax=Streptococcus sp. DD10 TaxID=1777878 RepID=UPI000794BA7D|nr:hypothetical protein [Streptococcus sp. DD10]KXT75186.1 hypothetical protein STRDD10_00422 [Streptococcus sp. DD10]
METVIRIVGVIGSVLVVSGLLWALSGVYDFFRGRHTGDKGRQSDGQEAMVNGGALAAISGGIVTGIVAALQAITF